MNLRGFFVEPFEYKNYTDCTQEEQKLILRWRNDESIRRWMANDKPILEVDHFIFINYLRRDKRQAYFAVFMQNEYIASVYINNIDGDTCERGLYVLPAFHGKGITERVETIFLKYLRNNGIRYVKAEVKVSNLRSARYHIKMGYKENNRDCNYIYYILDTQMITNVNRKGYFIDGFSFKDFTTLTLDEKKMVLEWRNAESVRKWMYNKQVIDLENHLRFIDGLKERDDCYYWLVSDTNGEGIGAFYVSNIDRENDRAELGLYLKPDSEMIGFFFVRQCYYFYFYILDFNNLYCSVDQNNKSALLIDTFFGCDFLEKKTIEGNQYLVSTNLTKDSFEKRYNLSFKDYILFVRNNKINSSTN